MAIDKSVNQRFSSRTGLLLSALGIAVGTGNIWRFPRIAAQNGGEEGAGALIIAWIVFLFLWSIPLIISEYLIGKKHRSGVVGAFSQGMGKKWAWMGSFVAIVATAISFFYAVIVGWSLYYFIILLVNPLPADASSAIAIWDNFQSGYLPFLTHLIAVALGIIAISKGIRSIEKVNKILIPVLIVIILFAVFRAVSLPGAGKGIAYLFRPDWSQLKDPQIWLQALTQNAWDTGAGWGLFMTYAAYMKIEHGSVKNAFITGIGNNTISILMAIMIFGTVFSVMQSGLGYTDAQVLEVMQRSGPASTGLTFIWMPRLFAMMTLGKPLAVLFFLGLSFAGFSSLISMFELSTRVLVDRGINRKKALWMVVAVAYIFGVPSAIKLDILTNQDFVWGLGLIISGVFIAIHAVKMGLENLKSPDILSSSDWKLRKIWDILLKYFIPVAGTVLLLWWMYLSATVFAPGEWYNPFNPFSVMTCLLQWGGLIAIFIFFNKKIAG